MNHVSLIVCPACQRQVSAQASACPECGHPIVAYRGFEWCSRVEIAGWPLIHIAYGRDAKTGKLLIARGIIAIGQFGIGVVTIAQFGIGVLFGFGQFIAGYTVVAQFALGYYFAIGQFACATTVIGQFAVGKYVLAQGGFGEYLWSVKTKNPEAIEYFKQLWQSVKDFVRF